jgi:hypothetical protein
MGPYQQRLWREHQARRARFFPVMRGPPPEPPALPEPEPEQELSPLLVYEPEPRPYELDGRLTLPKIVRFVAHRYSMTPDELLNNSHRHVYALPRQIVMYLAHRDGRSLNDIAHRIRRDHSTVLHALRKLSARRDRDEEFRQHLDQLERELRAL